MLTRRQALQAIIAAPAFRLVPIAPAPAAYTISSKAARTITLPDMRPGEKLTFTFTIRHDGGTTRTETVTVEGRQPC